jgi:peptidoglycan pentaglycine glycine transferase (the first glycine)
VSLSKVVSVTEQNSKEYAKKWRDFVGASPYGDVLQTLEWGAVKKPELIPIAVAIEEDGELQATCLVFKKSLPAGRSTLYLSRGPILDWNNEKLVRDMFAKLREVGKTHKALYIRTDPCVLDETPKVKELLTSMGFAESSEAKGLFGGLQPRCNMKLDISAPIEEVFEKKFEAKWRYNTRLATKKGVTVRDDLGREGLKIFHDIYKVTSARNGFTGYSLAYFQKMWDALEPAGIIKLFVTYHEEQPLSAAISFVLGDKAWYMFGASSNEKRNLMPNHLMQWTMMQWAKERGADSYDFRGVPDPNMHDIPAHEEGLVKFKTGFGAEMVRYIGEYDLILRPTEYKLWSQTRPKLVAAIKKIKK